MDNIIKKEMHELPTGGNGIKFSRVQFLILMGYLFAIIAAEVMTTYFNIEIGLLIHSIILFMLLVHSSLEKSPKFSNILTCMIAIPMIRIIGLSIPLLQVPTLYWFPVIAIPLFVSAIFIIRVQKTNLKTLGLNFGNIPVQLTIGFTGIILGFIEYQILHPKPLIAQFNMESLLFAGIILLISTGFAEELLFRGIIQRNAENLLGKILGLLYTSLLFTSLHIGWQSLFDLFFVFGVAMFYGYIFQRTRSLFGVTLSHGLSNTVLFLIMPFIVFS
ncbi:lysostaphin resistance A-like protein [Methanobacterium sp.]|uniref:CPBP family intramembrane glutamic endopeptidase n=1 Tax=Methanobacterium sp. TaxID=2164 RepID=UPI003C7617C4